MSPAQQITIEAKLTAWNATLRELKICEKSFSQALFKKFKKYLILKSSNKQYKFFNEIEDVQASVEEQIGLENYETLLNTLSDAGSLHKQDKVLGKYRMHSKDTYLQKLLFQYSMMSFLQLVGDRPTLKAFSLVLPYIQKHLNYCKLSKTTFSNLVQIMRNIVDYCLTELHEPQIRTLV
ncbi:hypothetical protein FGO68_gene10956 [Halteria grandinella]|uniref:Uncharacterized protein n=1 Tax=Halteria grandinella TaxID=5974 RepID=A0A8J8T604_HALGN|nr:hypothetical protein FGO68_gene10956 [Halteria grandinella]